MRTLFALALVAFALSACGKRAPLRVPPAPDEDRGASTAPLAARPAP